MDRLKGLDSKIPGIKLDFMEYQRNSNLKINCKPDRFGVLQSCITMLFLRLLIFQMKFLEAVHSVLNFLKALSS